MVYNNKGGNAFVYEDRRKQMKYGVQQMMLGSICTSEETTKEVLKKIRQAGYEGIEVNQYMVHPTSVFVRGLTRVSGMPSGNAGKYDWPSLLKETGLKAISLHSDIDTIEKKCDFVVEDVKRFGVKDVVITGLYYYPYQREEKVEELCQRLNACGMRMKENGLNLLYHNHNIEFMKVNEKYCAFDLLRKHTDKDFVNFELDAYWLADSGRDPLRYMKKLGERMKFVHISDRGIRLKRNAVTPIVKYDSVELGTGNLDLDKIFDYCEKQDVDYCILETHKNWINNSPLDSILLSSQYLKKRKTI